MTQPTPEEFRKAVYTGPTLDPFYEKLVGHYGHHIEIAFYGVTDGKPLNVAVECRDCSAILADANRYLETDHD